ncbi:hypothetical protein LZ32DRAFT_114157 [Colletotrichum eremochloae]|nr:hypothetical protein LZ32DRAFT_114157 [Colletotrichum eremochloae]
MEFVLGTGAGCWTLCASQGRIAQQEGRKAAWWGGGGGSERVRFNGPSNSSMADVVQYVSVREMAKRERQSLNSSNPARCRRPGLGWEGGCVPPDNACRGLRPLVLHRGSLAHTRVYSLRTPVWDETLHLIQ